MELQTAVGVPQAALFIWTFNLVQHVHAENISFLYNQVRGEDVSVKTLYGDVLGRRKTFLSDNVGGVTTTVDHYLGIPYAEPPVGDLRFAPPRRKAAWTSLLEATRAPHVCPQPLHYNNYTTESTVSEDCLYLNVYAPYQDMAPNRLYPVMVFIHGGAYSTGGAVGYPARALAQQGVVVVVINYRLGIMGFMTSGDEEFAGNYGLMDILQAMQWVKETIRAFRGDRDRVTIFGNSAGGGAVGLLCVSPLARGLFKYAIAQSGSISSPWALLRRTVDVRTVTFNIGYKLGCRTNHSRDLLHCLRKVDWKRFQEYQYERPALSPLGLNYVPRVDGRVVTEYPDATLRHHHINPEALLTGVTRDELTRNLSGVVSSVYKGRGAILENMQRGFSKEVKEKVLTTVLREDYHWSNKSIRVLLHEYTDWAKPDDPISNRDLTAQALSDLMITAPMFRSAELVARRDVPVYVYLFAYRDTRPPERASEWYRNTSYHMLDMNYVLGSVFDNVNVETGGRQSFTQDDQQLSRKVMKLWVNFAANGEPGSGWLKFNPKTTDYYEINLPDNQLKQHFKARRMSFWNKLAYEIEDNADFVNPRLASAINPGLVSLVFLCLAAFLAVIVILLLGALVFKYLKKRRSGVNASKADKHSDTQSAND